MTEEVAEKVLSEKDHSKSLVKLLEQVAYNKPISKVFADFVEMSAITIANSCTSHRDKKWDEREKCYLEIIHSYKKEHQLLFPEMFSHLVLELNKRESLVGPEDVLGQLYVEFELNEKRKAQMFTPQSVSDLMAFISLGSDIREIIRDRGFLTMAEPACGSGVMVTSMCKAMAKHNLNYQTQLLVTATDIDIICVYMTYVQLSLYGVPAVVIHGDTLTLDEWSRWYTPLHILHGW